MISTSVFKTPVVRTYAGAEIWNHFPSRETVHRVRVAFFPDFLARAQVRSQKFYEQVANEGAGT